MSDLPDLLPPESDDATIECLRNPDLLEEILGHIPSAGDPHNLRAQRQSLLWIASTCKAFPPSAMRLLWRRLDNLRPLLCLLPSFTSIAGSALFLGSVGSHEWAVFDRYAIHVKEIANTVVDIENSIMHIDPSVYFRLALRCPPILPNLIQVECTASQALASEIFVYMQSPLQRLQLGGLDVMPDVATQMVVSSLSSQPLRISSLVFVNQPCSILSEGITLEHLTSLDLRDMKGAMPISLIRQIGSLSHLRSLAADTKCFTGASLAAFPDFKSLADSADNRTTLFMGLTYLELRAKPSTLSSGICVFLQIIGTQSLRSLVLQESAPALWNSNKIEGDSFHTIIHRWSKTLRTLELEVYNLSWDNLKLLNRLSALRSVRLSGSLLGPYCDISSVCTGLSDLEVFSFRCRSFTPISFDIRSITVLAENCPKLQELDVAISARELPSLSLTPMISHSLGTIIVHSHSPEIHFGPTPPDAISNTLALARHLDRLFPRLSTVRYDAGSGARGAIETAWAQVQELVFAFQDVRRESVVRR
ncbi:hypothetical protein C8R44DRAFT_356053 [Mycena epipterygia]|nr:hypothetical protein C8R44DRAFT_356053 [Mycena epipterygia]